MKTTMIIAILMFALSPVCKSQDANATFFTTAGEKFTVYLNDAKINSTADSIVRATEVKFPVKVRVEFYGLKNPTLLKEITRSDIGVSDPQEVTFRIRGNREKKYASELYSIELVDVKEKENRNSPPTTPTKKSGR